MWPWVIGSAALGGLQAYQQSGGDLGKTLAGATIAGGLGSLVPGIGGLAEQQGMRLAGTRLAPLLETIVGKTLSPTGAAKVAKAGGTLARSGVGLAAIPAITGISSALSGVPGQIIGAPAKAAQAALGGGLAYKAASAPEHGLPNVPSVSDYVKATGQLPTVANTLGNLNSPFYLAMGEAGIQGDVLRNINEKNIQMEYPYISQFKKDDLDRNLYAAQVRQNIATNANLIQSSVGTAQQMGINAGQQLGQALTANYNYA
jgi:hypothetical protein